MSTFETSVNTFSPATPDATLSPAQQTLLGKWGYPDAQQAPEDLIEIAEQIANARHGVRAGDYVVKLGFATREQVDELMKNKPSNVLTLEHLSNNIDNLRASIQRIVAYTEKRPYYTKLPATPSPMMDKSGIREACGHETVLIDTPSGRPCLVFTENSRLKEFEQMARDKRASNPLYKIHAAGPDRKSVV